MVRRIMASPIRTIPSGSGSSLPLNTGPIATMTPGMARSRPRPPHPTRTAMSRLPREANSAMGGAGAWAACSGSGISGSEICRSGMLVSGIHPSHPSYQARSSAVKRPSSRPCLISSSPRGPVSRCFPNINFHGACEWMLNSMHGACVEATCDLPFQSTTRCRSFFTREDGAIVRSGLSA